MTDIDKWRVVTHMAHGFKIILTMEGAESHFTEEMAYEHARFIIERGPYMTDSRGVRTYYKLSDVDKVKVLPPGVTLNASKTVKE